MISLDRRLINYAYFLFYTYKTLLDAKYYLIFSKKVITIYHFISLLIKILIS